MKRRINIGIGCLCLFVGWFGSFILNSLASGYELYVLGPTLVIAIGLGLVWKSSGGRIAALSLAFTALLALLSMNQFYPERALSVPALKKRFQESAGKGRDIIIKVPDTLRSGPFIQDHPVTVFADIQISLFAHLPNTPADIVYADNGRFFVSIPELSAIYLLQFNTDTGFADQPVLFHYGLDRPSGLAYEKQTLYVAEPDRIIALRDSGGTRGDDIRIVLADLPADGGHWRRSLISDSKGYLYVGVGSRCDACEEVDPRRATVLRVDSRSGASEVFASGLRNSGGLAIDPADDQLWSTEQGRVGNGSPAAVDEINQLVAGGDYGWPYCYGQQVVDSGIGLGSEDKCSKTIASRVDLPPGSFSAGIVFGFGLNGPDEFKESLYVALTEEGGDGEGRVIRVPLKKGIIDEEPLEFIKGVNQGDFRWRPRSVVVGEDGALYVTDVYTDAVYRISWPGDLNKI